MLLVLLLLKAVGVHDRGVQVDVSREPNNYYFLPRAASIGLLSHDKADQADKVGDDKGRDSQTPPDTGKPSIRTPRILLST